jgi:V/A-type H+-transporting ATPase subunit D
MSKINVTRAQLLANQAQIELAEQGLELLQQKRAALLRELMRMADEVLVQRDALEARAAAARRALARAEAVAGEAAVRSAALAAGAEIPLRVSSRNVMGVSVPVIERRTVARSVLGRGYSLSGTSVTIDEAAEAYEDTVDAIIELADSELRLQPLADEIQRTTRRANALEHVILPRLRREVAQIEQALAERERAAHFRLKRVKQRLERQ